LKPGRKYCTVGRLGHEFGWKYQDVVARYVWSGLHTKLSLIKFAGSRRGGRSRAPHTTSARRLPGGTSPRPRRRPRLTMRSSSSSLSTDTRVWPRHGMGSQAVDNMGRRESTGLMECSTNNIFSTI
jgi:hypothetical protein